MNLTFVHTSDWHLGRSYERLGPRSAEMRRWRFDAVRNVYELALREQADFIVVAGDVFQTDTPRSEIVAEVVALLRDAPVPMILIPGNHDPVWDGSVWRRDEFLGGLAGVANVKLALSPEPIELPACRTIVYPCPVTSKHYPEDITAWIPSQSRGADVYRIGLAHGGWQGYSGQQYSVNFIAADRAEAAGLDYLALGDFHSYTLPDHLAAQARCFYSGTSECTAVDEQRPGHALVVRIAAPGTEPTAEPHRVGRLRPVALPPFVLSPGAGFQHVREQVEAIGQPDDVLLGLTVSGALSDREHRAFLEWSNRLDERFLCVERQYGALYREPSNADFAELSLLPCERRVLDLLHDPDDLRKGLAGAEDAVLESIIADPQVRREAAALYFQLLKNEGAECTSAA